MHAMIYGRVLYMFLVTVLPCSFSVRSSAGGFLAVWSSTHVLLVILCMPFRVMALYLRSIGEPVLSGGGLELLPATLRWPILSLCIRHLGS